MNVFNPLPSNKIVDCFKLKEFADNKTNIDEKLKFGFGKVETLWEKEKMLVTSIFSFSHVYKKLLLPVSLKVWIMW